MKKWISLLCVCMLIFGTFTASVVSASADVEKKETAIDVKKGDEVTYIFSLDKASEPVVGTDFSFYYDSAVFSLDSVADYNDNTNPDEWIAVINTDLDGEVRGVWSILKGVDFSSKRHFITLNLKAKEDSNDTHISYRIRFLYGNLAFDANDPKPVLETYEFTDTVLVNGEEVIKDAPPEWNDSEPEEHGNYIPSYDGTSKNADPDIPGVVDQSNKSGNAKAQNAGNQSADNGNSANNGAANNGAANAANGGSAQNNAAANAAAAENGNKSDASATTAPAATTADGYFVIATDADGNVTATSDQAPVVAGTDDKKGGSPILWIIIALVVIAGGGAAVYFFMKKKPADNAAAAVSIGGAENAPADAPEAATPIADAPETVEAEAPAEENTQSVDDSSES